eukprot:scaffold157022_cov22-Prasinocladus_malaysianus.AAC.1
MSGGFQVGDGAHREPGVGVQLCLHGPRGGVGVGGGGQEDAVGLGDAQPAPRGRVGVRLQQNKAE